MSHSDRKLTPIHLKPSFPELTLPPLGDIPFTDRGHFADTKKANLYAEAASQGGSVKHYTPVLGVEFKGVSLKQLSKQALDDLALLIAERGVVGKSFCALDFQSWQLILFLRTVFRKQDDLSIEDQLAIGAHWGPCTFLLCCLHCARVDTTTSYSTRTCHHRCSAQRRP